MTAEGTKMEPNHQRAAQCDNILCVDYYHDILHHPSEDSSVPIQLRALPVCLIAILYIASASAAGDKPQAEAIPEDLTFTALDGGEIRIGDLRGRVVLLDFWFSACVPCRNALPKMRSLHKKYGEDELVMIGISIDQDREVLEKFIVDEDMSWTHVWDPQRAVARAFGVASYPSFLVLDHEGRPVYLDSGWSDRAMMRLTGSIKSHVKRARKANVGSE